MLEYILLLSLLCYAISRCLCGRTNSKVCLIGKTAIITGANGGLGVETALILTSRGCRVILTDITDMKETKKEIITKTHNSNIETKHLNLASFKSVREFVDDINKTEEKIDILINNAGIASSRGKFTEDGLPLLMQVNYYGHFLLTHLLIGRMKKSDDPRIIFVSSFATLFQNLTLTNMKQETYLGYPNSKLCMVIASNIFSKILKDCGFSVNALNPGLITTNIYLSSLDKNDIISGLCIMVFYILSLAFGKTINEGVQTTIHLATSNALKNNSGKYYNECKPLPVSTFVSKLRDKHFCGKVWSLSEELVGLKPSEKLK